MLGTCKLRFDFEKISYMQVTKYYNAISDHAFKYAKIPTMLLSLHSGGRQSSSGVFYPKPEADLLGFTQKQAFMQWKTNTV